MKLLITGASGFLGRRTAVFFEQRGYQVLTPAHNQLDITEEDSVLTWFRENRPDAVIHTAAISDTGVCQQRPEWSEKINVDGCVNLAKACRETGAKLLICSSDQVYAGSPVPGPHREEESVTPSNVYGNQKLRAEQLCLEILPETVCLRLSWMYSRESLPEEHGHFLTVLRAALADEEQTLTWPVHDHRGLTDAEDVIRNFQKAILLPGGIYNFGAENQDNTYETVKKLLEKLELDSALARLRPNEGAFADHPRDISMDTARIQAAGIAFPSTGEGLLRVLIDWKKEGVL